MMEWSIRTFALAVAILVITVLALYSFTPHSPETPLRVKRKSELEKYFDQLVESGNPPGLSVVVVKNDKVVYNHAFGYADAPNKIKATPETVYHWWSMTKIPTAMAVLQLQERGKLSIDDEVSTHLPWFEAQYPSSDSRAITLRHLLQHSSGLPDTMPAMVGWVHYEDSTLNQTEIVKTYLPEYNTLKFEPGTRAIYSNFNYMVLGALIESVSNQTYEGYITENILQPLRMDQTGFVYSSSMTENEAFGTLPVVHYYTPMLPFLLDMNTLIHERDGKILWMNRVYINATPSTGLIGSGNDLARFMSGYLTRYTLDGKMILSPESFSTLTDTGPLDGQGLGWHIGESKGHRYLEHAGGGPGFATVMRLYPENGLGIALLANGTDMDREGLLSLLSELDW